MLSVLLTVTFAGAASAQQRTKVNDTKAARLLLGRHLFSLQWISWDHYGTATVKNQNGLYRLNGEQKGRGESKDVVQIDGLIYEINARDFRFSGRITTRVSHINGGEPCEREGEFTFKITGRRKYWRLQEMDSPCDNVTDYIDVFFR